MPTAMFGTRLSEERKSHKMTQVQLAQMLNVTKQTVSNWEHGEILPSVELLEKIADIMDVTTDYLLDRDRKLLLEYEGLKTADRISIQQLIKVIIKSYDA